MDNPIPSQDVAKVLGQCQKCSSSSISTRQKGAQLSTPTGAGMHETLQTCTGGLVRWTASISALLLFFLSIVVGPTEQRQERQRESVDRPVTSSDTPLGHTTVNSLNLN